jgi:predicted tellurium resistance membrane protein TerC
MNQVTRRSVLRWIHLVFSIPILGYVYSPFEDIPHYAPVVRFAAVPVIVLTGLWMWKGQAFGRLLSRGQASVID